MPNTYNNREKDKNCDRLSVNHFIRVTGSLDQGSHQNIRFCFLWQLFTALCTEFLQLPLRLPPIPLLLFCNRQVLEL